MFYKGYGRNSNVTFRQPASIHEMSTAEKGDPVRITDCFNALLCRCLAIDTWMNDADHSGVKQPLMGWDVRLLLVGNSGF